jgi:hypothetical protein
MMVVMPAGVMGVIVIVIVRRVVMAVVIMVGHRNSCFSAQGKGHVKRRTVCALENAGGKAA